MPPGRGRGLASSHPSLPPSTGTSRAAQPITALERRAIVYKYSRNIDHSSVCFQLSALIHFSASGRTTLSGEGERNYLVFKG